jgi:hypothetical protein
MAERNMGIIIPRESLLFFLGSDPDQFDFGISRHITDLPYLSTYLIYLPRPPRGRGELRGANSPNAMLSCGLR